MSCLPFASDMVASIRDTLKPHLGKGVWLSPTQLDALLRCINSVHAVARETEEELRLLEYRFREYSPVPVKMRHGGNNIVSFPKRKHQQSPVSGNDGGDAA